MSKQTFRYPDQAENMGSYLLALMHGSEHPWRVTIEPWKDKRTNAQNRYLWGVVYTAFAQGLMEQGRGPIDKDGLHYICAEQFLPRVQVGKLGRTRPMSTTELCKSGNEDSFNDYIEQIKALAAHYEIYIPEPGEEE